MLRSSLALGLGELDYVVATTRHILQYFPSHLRARVLLGQALLDRSRYEDAEEQFEAVILLDPENVMARAGLAAAMERQGRLKGAIEQLTRAVECEPGNREVQEALSGARKLLVRSEAGGEASRASKAKTLAGRGNYGEAAAMLAAELSRDPERGELELARIDALWRSGRWNEAATGAQEVLARRPRTVRAAAFLARFHLQAGDAAQAVALIHDVRSLDPSDSILGPMLAADGYRLPPLATAIDVPVPDLETPPRVEQALAAGVTEFAPVEQESDAPTPVVVMSKGGGPPAAARELSAVLDKVADSLAPRPSRPAGKDTGGYALVTMAGHLRRLYGERGAARIHQRLVVLRDVLREKGYAAEVVLLDHSETMTSLGLAPVSPSHPEAIRSAVIGIEDHFQSRSVKLDHTLIVGGPEIVPFVRLNNPADDDDPDVVSDIPYAVTGANFYVEPRSIGRLPGGSGPNPALLLALIDRAIARYRDEESTRSKPSRLLRLLKPWAKGSAPIEAFGYAAAAWRHAAESVLGRLGKTDSLKLSPPVTEHDLEEKWLRNKDFYLFNLHGTENSAAWYGQKDSSYPEGFSGFPVALRPEAFDAIDLDGAIVFTEACYGVNIVDKAVEEAMSLRLLERGAACVVGCTKIAYGSDVPPLTGADLLAAHFVDFLRAGYTAGGALAAAKGQFLAQVQRRQGYLDGDDQKTLVGFNLLGDPGARLKVDTKAAAALKSSLAKNVDRDAMSGPPSLYCKVRAHAAGTSAPDGELIRRAKVWLERGSPGMADGELEFVPKAVCNDPSLQACEECGACMIDDPHEVGGGYLITTRKSMPLADGTRLNRIARATVGAGGELVKLSLSK